MWTVTWIEADETYSDTFRTKRIATQFARLLRKRPEVTNLVIHRTGTSAY